MFMKEKRADFLKQTAGKPACEATKLGAAAWQKLSEAKKVPYQKAFEVAQAKYTTDMAAFLEAGGVKAKGVAGQRSEKRKEKENKTKDPNRPKKPAGGAYGCFLNANRAEYTKKCAGQPMMAITKMAGAEWKKVSEKDRAHYEKLYQEKKSQYDEAMRSYVPPEGAEEEDEGEDQKDDEVEAEDKEEDAEEAPPKKKARTTKANQKAQTTDVKAKSKLGFDKVSNRKSARLGA